MTEEHRAIWTAITLLAITTFFIYYLDIPW